MDAAEGAEEEEEEEAEEAEEEEEEEGACADVGRQAGLEELELCTCSGNCGWKLCKRNQNNLRRGGPGRVCAQPVSRRPGAAFCTRCQCELEDCTSPRLARHRRRWCHAHGADPGHWESREDWSLALNFVAKLAPVLVHITPDDFSCLTELGRELGGVPGTRVQGLEFLFLFLGHAVKWPPVVRKLPTLLRGKGLLPYPAPPDGAEALTVLDYEAWAAPVAAVLHDLLTGTTEWTEASAGPRVGHVDVSAGLGPLAVSLGLLAFGKDAPRAWLRRKLGSQTYAIVPASEAMAGERLARMRSMLGQVFVSIENADWRWPAAAADVPAFLEQAVSIARLIRQAGQLPGGRVARGGYLVLSFVRNALVAQIAARMPGAMDTVSMEQVVIMTISYIIIFITIISYSSRSYLNYPTITSNM